MSVKKFPITARIKFSSPGTRFSSWRTRFLSSGMRFPSCGMKFLSSVGDGGYKICRKEPCHIK
jgi:hypothetical protein